MDRRWSQNSSRSKIAFKEQQVRSVLHDGHGGRRWCTFLYTLESNGSILSHPGLVCRPWRTSVGCLSRCVCPPVGKRTHHTSLPGHPLSSSAFEIETPNIELGGPQQST